MQYTLLLAVADVTCIVAGSLLLNLAPTIKNSLGRLFIIILGITLIRLVLLIMGN